jgi:hypothetical protein
LVAGKTIKHLLFLKFTLLFVTFCCNIYVKIRQEYQKNLSRWLAKKKILEMQFRTKIFQDIPIPLSVALQISGKQHFLFSSHCYKNFLTLCLCSLRRACACASVCVSNALSFLHRKEEYYLKKVWSLQILTVFADKQCPLWCPQRLVCTTWTPRPVLVM